MDIMSKLFERSSIGIDLGSAKMRVWVAGEGLVMEEPSAVALAIPREEMDVPAGDLQGQQDSKNSVKPCKYRILAIGEKAGEMLGKPPGCLVAIRPMKGGVVCDYDITKKMLCYCLAHEKVKKARKGRLRRPRAVIAIPFGITEVEKRALEDAAHSAGVGDVFLIEAPMAAAVGIADNGIVLTGGGALLRGLDKRLAEATGLPVRVADDPAHATIRGIGVVLNELDFLSKHSKKR